MSLVRSIKRLLRIKQNQAKPEWTDIYDVGQGTYGNPQVRHWGEPATLRVGAYCSIAAEVKIFLGGNHRTDWITTYPFSVFRASAKHIEGHPATNGDVVIGNDVWLGDRAVVLSGVKIGNGAVVGASAVVAKDVPPYAIVAGNPAKTIRYRFSDAEIKILEDIKWWNWSEEKLDAAMPHLLNNDIAALKAFSDSYELATATEVTKGSNKAIEDKQ